MKISDLFQRAREGLFAKQDYVDRVTSQNKLIDRLEEQFESTKVVEFRMLANEVKEFALAKVASVTYLEMIISQIEGLCKEHNIEVT